MNATRHSVWVVFALLLLGPPAGAQAIPKIGLTLDEQLFLVLTGDGFATPGIDIQSASGSLVPIPPGDATADASPFEFSLVNRPEQITLGNLGIATVVDGSVRLGARWNPGGERDIQYGLGPHRLDGSRSSAHPCNAEVTKWIVATCFRAQPIRIAGVQQQHRNHIGGTDTGKSGSAQRRPAP